MLYKVSDISVSAVSAAPPQVIHPTPFIFIACSKKVVFGCYSEKERINLHLSLLLQGKWNREHPGGSRNCPRGDAALAASRQDAAESRGLEGGICNSQAEDSAGSQEQEGIGLLETEKLSLICFYGLNEDHICRNAVHNFQTSFFQIDFAIAYRVF